MSSRATAPVFVIGSPRSGTTLLYHMLLSAGGFAYYRNETHVFNSLAPRCGDLARQANRDALLDIWLPSKMHARSGLAAEDVRALRDRFQTPGEFLSLVMGRIAEQQGVSRWAETTPAHVLHMEEIRAQIPDALFVHVIRDGRDVAVSLEKQQWIAPMPWDRHAPVLAAGAYWRWMVRRGRQSGKGLGNAYREVRYEALVERPRETLEALGTWLEHSLDYDRILANPVGSVGKPNTSFPGKDKKFTGRWSSELSPAVAEQLDALLSPLLRELGYATSPSEPISARLRQMAYSARFSARHWLKAHTRLGRRYADLGLFAPVVSAEAAPVTERP